MRVERKATTLPAEKPSTGASIVDVLDHILDKGIVIDAHVRVALAGIDLITVEARVLVASIETYLQHSEAVRYAGGFVDGYWLNGVERRKTLSSSRKV
jgi:gas vesicle structural protein